MGKPLSRPGCFRKSSCCLEKHGVGERVRGRDGMMEGGYGDGYVPQRSIYDTMCINQQIDSHHHHHHPGGSTRRDVGGEGSFYSASGSLRVSRSPAEMFDSQPCSLTPNPSFVRRLDERAIYDSLKLGAQDTGGGGCSSPGHFNRSVSPAVSSFSAPGVSSSSKKHPHHYHHHHGDSTKSRDGRHSWKVLTPPKHLECLDITTHEMMDRGGGGYLNPAHYSHGGGQSSSLTSPLISPFSGSPLSSGYHTPVFFSPAKPRPSQTQSLRCSPPHVLQPRHYSQTQSLRMSPPHELRRSPYRAPLVQLSAHDLELDLRDQGGWGHNEREREWEREREREMERGWAQREWERERERGRLERERARERERRDTSTFGTFGYGRPVTSERDSVFLESDHVLDTTPLLLTQSAPSPSPSAAPRMGTGAVGRNRAGSKVGSDSIGGGVVSKIDNGNMGLGFVESTPGCVTRLVSGGGGMSEADIMIGIQGKNRVENWGKYENGVKASIKNGSEKRMGSQVKTRAGGRDLEGKVESGVQVENVSKAANREGQRGGSRGGEKLLRAVTKPEPIAEAVPSTLHDVDNKVVPGEKNVPGSGSDCKMKPEIKTGPEMKDNSRLENNPGTEVGIAQVNEFNSAPASTLEPKLETELKIVSSCEPEAALDIGPERKGKGKEKEDKSNTETPIEEHRSTNKTPVNVEVGDKTETAPAEQAQKSPVDIYKIISGHAGKGSKSQKSKSSKSNSRIRPGTATGLRPGVLSPRLRKGLADLESQGPAEGIESTWPRRIMVRKRTVRQGGAIHNLPILPPLPSVISALEKRRPHAHLHSRPGHHSENPLTTDVTIFTGRCSLKEPSHQEQVQGTSLVGRASLKEQNLEHWRVYRDQEESRRSRSREKQGETSKESANNNEEKRGQEQIGENEKTHDKTEEKAAVGKQTVEEIKQDKIKISSEEKVQDSGVIEENLTICEKTENRSIKDRTQEQLGKTAVKVTVQVKKEECVMEGIHRGTFGEGQEVESWDSVLDMVNTLWDDGWEKGGATGGDTDSLSGSLQRWPLLRPPVGFGGSHPPSSAASELSLTELERRARELDSDLEHLDLSQPHRDTQDLYQRQMESQKERADMYQTHPGPQREKGPLLTGVKSRFLVNLELSSKALLPDTDPDNDPVGWSTKSSTVTSSVGISPYKEDSSPDSNLTLESDSSGIFLSSNQSQEEGGSDSDQPISGSDLGSSSTSLDKDGDDGSLKEWGREESADLQWCYPSLLNTSPRDDVGGHSQREEDACGTGGGDGNGWRDDKTGGVVSIYEATLDTNLNVSQSEAMRPSRKVTIIANDPLLPPSPLKQQVKHVLDPYHKPIRSSGLDCGDIDPYVQPDSFVYLAVSARPPGELPMVTDFATHDIKQENVHQHFDNRKTHMEQTILEPDAKPSHFVPHKPEEGDFLCTDSFVYLAAPACLLLGPEGSTSYSGRVSAAGPKPAGEARPKRLPAEPRWDSFGDSTEPEVPDEPFKDQDRNNKATMDTSGSSHATAAPANQAEMSSNTAELSSSTKKVTWQFKPAQRSVCTGSRKEKEMASAARITELGGGGDHRPPPSCSSPSSSSSSSSSSG
ncbi:uncharacterized protein LOC129192431 isoform X2 [Dunckerocampus dactyliophorus]|uniref:uncharacterized protein LOC129192431 isoform X2 n=1 Tax=Dunckerocampus dactyliophorus TaxID=161453 RepID=UPI002406A97A|nr:uncharacterized protein LOC129192431 isoform X2 [Dunckerocampus dactyliophorus]